MMNLLTAGKAGLRIRLMPAPLAGAPLAGAPLAGALLAGVLASVLAACAGGETPYGPKTDKSTFGYEEQRIESNRFRVVFNGNSRTPREVVETYLLFRAAEITKQNGADYFVVVKDDTEAKKSFHSSGRGGLDYYGFGRPFPYYGRGYPYGRFARDYDVREVTRYSAIAYIQIFKGDKPDAPAAYSADEVIANLGPQIQRAGFEAAE